MKLAGWLVVLLVGLGCMGTGIWLGFVVAVQRCAWRQLPPPELPPIQFN